MTTGENVVVTWENAQASLDAWQLETYYDKPDGAQRLIVQFGGKYGTDVETVPHGVSGTNRDDFCEALRYRYGASINLRESKAMNPKVYNEAQIKGQKP